MSYPDGRHTVTFFPLHDRMAPLFTTYIGIDYSGAGTSVQRNPGLQVFKATRRSAPRRAASPTGRHRHWTRKEIAHWCRDQLDADGPVVIGIDHGFSFPLSYMKHFRIASWDHFLEDFRRHWPTDRDESTVEALRPDNPRTGRHTAFRLTENWTAGAQSVFKLDGAGTVGKATHCGLPWLRFIRRNPRSRRKPHFWPFDGFAVPPGASVVAEIFPSLFRRRYPRSDASPDAHDPRCVARWLKEMDQRGHLQPYFAPPLTAPERATARLEGWILGVY